MYAHIGVRVQQWWRTGILCACVALSGCTDSSDEDIRGLQTTPTWPTYRGAWFEIRYPPSFVARPSLASGDSNAFDSVFFLSPGKQCAFYVLSPQWGREPLDVLVDDNVERLEQEQTQSGADGTQKTTLTIGAIDGGYTRLVERHSTQQGVINWTFAFQFTMPEAHEKCARQYEKFKASLVQHTD